MELNFANCVKSISNLTSWVDICTHGYPWTQQFDLWWKPFLYLRMGRGLLSCCKTCVVTSFL